jgi:transcriptional regulator with XRE-family HTH domain
METLKRLRRASGLTQAALAKKSKVQRWKVAHVELDLATFTPEEQSRVLKALAEAISENAKIVNQSLESVAVN